MIPAELRTLASERGWSLQHERGSAAVFHGRELPDPVRRAIWWFEVDRSTVVLGSTQRSEVIDAARAASLGVDVVRRRSGGSAVWLAPGHVTWIDVVLPAGDRQWSDDVGVAAHWLGQAWVDALADLGRPGAEVHRGGMIRSPWSELLCFAGLGPGEVMIDGAKIVGISQRRTRAGARFQCAVLHRWDPVPLLACCDLTPDERAVAATDLADRTVGIGPVESVDLIAALVHHLP